MVYIPKLEDMSYYECTSCKNFFFTVEMVGGINDPSYCPYCGVEFRRMTIVNPEDREEEGGDVQWQ